MGTKYKLIDFDNKLQAIAIQRLIFAFSAWGLVESYTPGSFSQILDLVLDNS